MHACEVWGVFVPHHVLSQIGLTPRHNHKNNKPHDKQQNQNMVCGSGAAVVLVVVSLEIAEDATWIQEATEVLALVCIVLVFFWTLFFSAHRCLLFSFSFEKHQALFHMLLLLLENDRS